MSSERPPLTRFVSASGARVYRLPVETFPAHVNNLYLILDDGQATLFDVGSGLPRSAEELRAGVREVAERFGERVSLEGIGHVVISHAHIDHFGHVTYFREATDATIYVHELDARVLNNFEERIVMTSRDLRVFLERAGVGAEACRELVELYRLSKAFFKSVEVDRTLRGGERIVNGYLVHHVPGHCPGQICLQVGDLLLTADHVLARITPHQSPAAITAFCGLELYLHSLEKVRGLPGVRLALPGHGREIEDLPGRIDAIAAHHRRRLDQVLDLCRSPRTVAEVTEALFGRHEGYTRLLALEEAGAHVEYLFQRGELRIANLETVAEEASPVIAYVARRAR